MNRFAVRIFFDIVLAFVIIQGWWFVAIPIALAGIWLFPFFIEAIIAGIAYDSLFGLLPEGGIRNFSGTILSVTTYAVVIGLKGVVRKS